MARQEAATHQRMLIREFYLSEGLGFRRTSNWLISLNKPIRPRERLNKGLAQGEME
jgi:hypothetical protein